MTTQQMHHHIQPNPTQQPPAFSPAPVTRAEPVQAVDPMQQWRAHEDELRLREVAALETIARVLMRMDERQKNGL